MNKGQNLYKKAKKIIPGGTQLLSKRPEMFLPGNWPSYYSRAKGCYVWDLDGNKYVDASLMGVGANVLGYAYDDVDNAAKEAIDSGGMCSLNAPEEVDLAKLLCDIHPWANSVRYAKSGGEAMSMAARIVRAYSKKDIILVCGYHGWQDWYLAANLSEGDPLSDVHLKGLDPAGVPKGLSGTTKVFNYNDIKKFKVLVNEYYGKIAAVIMEPIRNDEPKDDFLGEIREITKSKNIPLVFDEISSGFRICTGGSHLKLGVEPDVAVFAKAMTNGYPLAAIIGRKEVMSAAEETFISSTFWTERVSLAATLQSIKSFRSNNVSNHLNRIGKKVQDGWQELSQRFKVPIDVGGIYPMSHFSFELKNPLAFKTFFTQEMLKKGYLATTAFYISFSHSEEVIDKYLEVCEDVFRTIGEIVTKNDDIEQYLDGPVCHSGFERLN